MNRNPTKDVVRIDIPPEVLEGLVSAWADLLVADYLARHTVGAGLHTSELEPDSDRRIIRPRSSHRF
jgi:hypothetical protein